MRVLIIEDAELPLEYMAEVLCGMGHTVHAAPWMTRAREMLSRGGYDLVLLDHRLPIGRYDQDEPVGYGLIDEISRTNPAAVIVGTSSLTADEVRRSGYTLPSTVMDKTSPWENIPRMLEKTEK